MKQLLSAIIVSALTAPSLFAVNPAEFPLLELGKDYQVQAFKEFKGKIVTSEGGMMIEYGEIPAYNLDSKGELVDIDGWDFAGYINGRQAYQFPVEAGHTYYIYSGFVMNSGTIRFEMNPKLEIVGMSPNQGEQLSISAADFVSVTFNQNVNIGSASITCGSHSEPVATRFTASDYSILVRDVLSAWYDNGIISGGETLTILLSDITDAIGTPQADIELKYIAAPAPAKLLSAVLPEAILSYMPESSEATKAVFTFSKPLALNPNVQLCYAPTDGLGYEYTEQIQAEVNGCVLTIDFAGKLRSSQQMSATGAKFDNFDLRLFSLRDASGQLVLANGDGMLGSFHLQIPYVEIARVNIVTQFTPESGSDLTRVESLGIYFNNASAVTFSGVTFSSHGEQVVVNNDEITSVSFGNDDVELTVPIPAGWNAKSDVIVGLADLSVTDGMDHSADFYAKYNGFTILFANPAADSRLASLSVGRTITIDTNLDSGAKVTFAVTDGSTVVYGPVEMTERSAGSFIHTMQSEVTFYSGTTYSLEFTSGNSTESISVAGTSAPFEFSPTQFIGITPADGASLKADAVITIQFDGLVLITPADESAPFTAACVSDDSESGYDNTWTITPDNADSANLVIAFYATDQDSLTVQGNTGEQSLSHFRYTFNVESGILSIEAANGSETPVIYNLQGCKLSHPQRGINIINGQKHLIP